MSRSTLVAKSREAGEPPDPRPLIDSVTSSPSRLTKTPRQALPKEPFSKKAAHGISVLASRSLPLSRSPARRQNRTNRIEIYLNAYSVVSRNAPPFPSRHADIVKRARFGREALCNDFAHRPERFELPIDDRRRKPFEYSWVRPEKKPHELLQSHPTVSSVSSSRQFIVSRVSLSRKYSSTSLA